MCKHIDAVLMERVLQPREVQEMHKNPVELLITLQMDPREGLVVKENVSLADTSEELKISQQIAKLVFKSRQRADHSK